jgi:hypothetical protein
MPGGQAGSVDLARLTDELDSLFEETTVYVNRKTGEIVTVLAPDLDAIEDGEEDFEPEADDDLLPVPRSVVESPDWVAMPDKFEIHEWQIMSDFAVSLANDVGEELARAIRGRGAFRMFKDAVYRHGIHEKWFEFRRLAVEQIAVRALEAEDIPYHRGQRPIASARHVTPH